MRRNFVDRFLLIVLTRASVSKIKKAKKNERSKLSFLGDGEDSEDVHPQHKRPHEVEGKALFWVFCRADQSDGENAKKRFVKNPGVDTSFLPDREREEEDRIQREELRKDWLAQQERLKGEAIEITYSFWDGSGHRKTVEVSLQSCSPESTAEIFSARKVTI